MDRGILIDFQESGNTKIEVRDMTSVVAISLLVQTMRQLCLDFGISFEQVLSITLEYEKENYKLQN
jgi:hypothetical protein